MKIITFDGRLGKDAEVLKTKDGKPFVRFSVANNSFSNGQEKTDWFDIMSFDSYFAEKRAQYLKKGTYVIISGPIESVVSVSNGKVYMNHHVTATSIDMPRFGKDSDGPRQNETVEEEPQVSVYTGGTKSDFSKQEEVPAYSGVPSYEEDERENDDDLPF